jgi:hypothetical protein
MRANFEQFYALTIDLVADVELVSDVFRWTPLLEKGVQGLLAAFDLEMCERHGSVSVVRCR